MPQCYHNKAYALLYCPGVIKTHLVNTPTLLRLEGQLLSAYGHAAMRLKRRPAGRATLAREPFLHATGVRTTLL